MFDKHTWDVLKSLEATLKGELALVNKECDNDSDDSIDNVGRPTGFNECLEAVTNFIRDYENQEGLRTESIVACLEAGTGTE